MVPEIFLSQTDENARQAAPSTHQACAGRIRVKPVICSLRLAQ
jgi:hypothetical protein